MNKYRISYKNDKWPDEAVEADSYYHSEGYFTFSRKVDSEDQEYKTHQEFLTVTDVKRVELV